MTTADAKVELVANLIEDCDEWCGGRSDALALARAITALEASPSMTEAMIEAFEWLLGIAAGVVEMGDPNYEKACALYEQLTAMQAARPIDQQEVRRELDIPEKF